MLDGREAVDHILSLQTRDLRRELERALARLDGRGQLQRARRRIVGAHDLIAIGARSHDRQVVRFMQMPLTRVAESGASIAQVALPPAHH